MKEERKEMKEERKERKIIEIKVVGLCSKCRKEENEIPRNKDGSIIKDKDISCINMILGSPNINRLSKQNCFWIFCVTLLW